jgi:hypothetical protein
LGKNFRATQDNKTYVGMGKVKRGLKIWPGSSHGADMVENEDASAFVIELLKGNL